jgi:hypothetical protein
MTNPAQEPTDEIRLFEDPGGEVRIEVRLVRDTVWLPEADRRAAGLRQVVFPKNLRGELPGRIGTK